MHHGMNHSVHKCNDTGSLPADTIASAEHQQRPVRERNDKSSFSGEGLPKRSSDSQKPSHLKVTARGYAAHGQPQKWNFKWEDRMPLGLTRISGA